MSTIGANAQLQPMAWHLGAGHVAHVAGDRLVRVRAGLQVGADEGAVVAAAEAAHLRVRRDQQRHLRLRLRVAGVRLDLRGVPGPVPHAADVIVLQDVVQVFRA